MGKTVMAPPAPVAGPIDSRRLFVGAGKPIGAKPEVAGNWGIPARDHYEK